MKIFIICMVLMIVGTTATYAQFEKDKWYVNASLTSLDLSHSDYEGAKLGFNLGAGTFLADNMAVLVNFKGNYLEHGIDETSVGAGMRYYFSNCGVYGGMGLSYKHLSNDDFKKNITCFTPEVGYAFFLNGILTIEPAVYYDWSLSNSSEYSKLGFKLGIGIYF